MGKRKYKDKDSHLKKKIRRLEKRLREYECSSDSSDNDEYRRDYRRSPSPRYYRSRSSSSERLYLTDSEGSTSRVKSVVTPVPTSNAQNNTSPENHNLTNGAKNPNPQSTDASAEPGPSASTAQTPPENLPDDILEALGDPKGKDEVLGPKIPDEIAKRWGRVLTDGLSKDQKQDITDKTLIPENFRLIKAPLLNPEIAPILGEAVKNRDKLLEKAQNHLGLGIAGLTSLASSIIRGDLDKIEILKKVSDISQIFLDLHHENTKTRRKLVMTSLDKKFTNIIKDVKRDDFLFGADLGEKIKATKTAERSGLQIKRQDNIGQPSRKYPQQGNWRGPPRTQTQRAPRQGGLKNRYYKRPPQPAADRPVPPKPSAKTRKP